MPRSNRDVLSGPCVHLRGPYFLLWLSVIILGLNWPVMKLALHHVTPFWMVTLRYCFSVPVIAAFILVLKNRLPRFERRDLRVILGVAFLQFVIQMGLVTFALQWVAAGTASILIYTTPVWLLLLDGIIFGQPVSASRLWPTLLSAAGCVLVLFGAGHVGDAAPLLLILAAALCWSCSMRLIASHVWSGEVPDALFWQFLIAGLVSLPIALAVEGGLELDPLSARGLALLVFVCPVATGLGFGLMVAVGRLLPVAQIALISTLSPVTGFLSSAVFLEDPLNLILVSGAVIMLLALLWGVVSGK
ncbi:putative permease (plasmid) [Phaeobacter gallaeciensis]|nr:putative permease [Phaeobacter gallaeciensis]ATF24763.1 putative permease [Phaeobacter gallaeciensis]